MACNSCMACTCTSRARARYSRASAITSCRCAMRSYLQSSRHVHALLSCVPRGVSLRPSWSHPSQDGRPPSQPALASLAMASRPSRMRLASGWSCSSCRSSLDGASAGLQAVGPLAYHGRHGITCMIRRACKRKRRTCRLFAGMATKDARAPLCR